MNNIFIILFVITLLIFFNGLYVLAEFAAVSARKARISQLAEDGSLVAKKVFTIIDSPAKLDAYVATSQVGITISSLVLGFYGQSQLSPYLSPVLIDYLNLSEGTATSISATVILIILTLFQVLFGELIPKNLGIQEPERFSIATARPLQWSSIFFRPLISLFNGSGIALMKLLRINPSTEHTHIHSPEEITLLFRESSEGGAISFEEYQLLTNTIHMRESMVKHIMIPRSSMLAATTNTSINEIEILVSNSPYSRIPIFEETIDNVIGIVHLRDLFCWQHTYPSSEDHSIQALIRPVAFVPETVKVKSVLSLLQKQQLQVAIILDEFGGTSGMVTLEDLIEEVFGDVQDEFDTALPHFQMIDENKLLIRGDTPISDINDLLNIDLNSENVDTIAGLITDTLGRFPTVQETINLFGIEFKIEKMRNRAITQVSTPVTPRIISRLEDQLK